MVTKRKRNGRAFGDGNFQWLSQMDLYRTDQKEKVATKTKLLGGPLA